MWILKIDLNPLVPKPSKFAIEQRKLREMLKIKKVAQRYDANGEKHYTIKDNEVRYKKSAPKALKHDRMEGPFAVIVYKTGSDVRSQSKYVYQGTIIVEEGETALVYRDSLDDGYTEALFTDDTTLLMDIRNKKAGEKFAVQIDGEPTLAACGKENIMGCFDFLNSDEPGMPNKIAIEKHVQDEAVRLGIPVENVYAVVQLDI